MTVDNQLQEKGRSLATTSEQEEIIQQRIKKLRQYLQEGDQYTIAKLWTTTPLGEMSQPGLLNRFDLIVLVHTDVSERELAKIFHEQLAELSDSTIVNKAVSLDVDGMELNVVPTKFAQQGSIGLDEEGILEFADIIGQHQPFVNASRLLQQWQYQQDLDMGTQALLPYEIELTLAHLLHEYDPDNLQELLTLFFKFGKSDRFATQLNIFDKHDNILLYHDFNIPDKQVFLESVFDSYDRFVNDQPDLSIFGI